MGSHHCCTVALDDKLHLAPLKKGIKVSSLTVRPAHLSFYLPTHICRMHSTSEQEQASSP